MARIPYAEIEKAPAEVREFLDIVPVQLNIFKMVANAETMFRPLFGLGTAILGRQQLDDKIREFVILDAVKVVGGEYEWRQHVAIAKAVGGDDAQIAAIEQGDVEAECFSESESDILGFAHESAKNYRVSDAAFERVRKHLSAREITELLLTIGFYQMLGRLTEATETEIDDAVGHKIVRQLKR
ncbi:MAG: alkylhydroperoxidase family enzyme [Hyphomicrobiaceae bacterium]|jgi:alkylhydroperoxidase family enzyme